MKEETLANYRFPWDSFVAGAFGGAIVLPFVSSGVFSFVYSALRRSGVGGYEFYKMLGPADESATLGIVGLFMFHVPFGFLFGALSGYCWGLAKNGCTRRAYLISHWSGLIISNTFLLLCLWSTVGHKGWVLSLFIIGFPLLASLCLFGFSFKWRRELEHSTPLIK